MRLNLPASCSAHRWSRWGVTPPPSRVLFGYPPHPHPPWLAYPRVQPGSGMGRRGLARELGELACGYTALGVLLYGVFTTLG